MTDLAEFETDVLLSVSGVARVMKVSKEFVRDAVRSKRLRAELILVGDRLGVSIPLSAVAEFWDLPKAMVNQIETEAGKGVAKAPVAVLTPLFSRGGGLHGMTAPPPTGVAE